MRDGKSEAQPPPAREPSNTPGKLKAICDLVDQFIRSSLHRPGVVIDPSAYGLIAAARNELKSQIEEILKEE